MEICWWKPPRNIWLEQDLLSPLFCCLSLGNVNVYFLFLQVMLFLLSIGCYVLTESSMCLFPLVFLDFNYKILALPRHFFVQVIKIENYETITFELKWAHWPTMSSIISDIYKKRRGTIKDLGPQTFLLACYRMCGVDIDEIITLYL